MSRFSRSQQLNRRLCSIAVCGAMFARPIVAFASGPTPPKRAHHRLLALRTTNNSTAAVRPRAQRTSSDKAQREALQLIDLGDNALSENNYPEAMRYFERALGLMSEVPEPNPTSTELRRKLASSYERWFRVVGDPDDLRKALVYAQGYQAGLGPEKVQEQIEARAWIERLQKELEPSQKEVPSPEPEPEVPPATEGKLVGKPQAVIAPPVLPGAVGAAAKRQRALRTGVIVTGALGWAGLVGAGASYYMYAKRFDDFFKLYVRSQADEDSVGSSAIDQARRRRNRWRYATLGTGALTAASFAAASIMLIAMARAKKRKKPGKKLWAWLR